MKREEETAGWEDWFGRVWAHREEVLYPGLFGPVSRGIFTIQVEMITGLFQQQNFDPRWLHCGVFEFGPTAARESWLYVTSGMSNDWEAEAPDAATVSGLGCEFVLETTAQVEWAILRLLHLMTFQILLCHGRFPGRQPIDDFDRVPLRSSIRTEPSALTWLMLAPPKGFAHEAQLESGWFHFHQVAGISEAEAAHARTHGGEVLLQLLTERSYFPVIDADRQEVSVGAE